MFKTSSSHLLAYIIRLFCINSYRSNTKFKVQKDVYNKTLVPSGLSKRLRVASVGEDVG